MNNIFTNPRTSPYSVVYLFVIALATFFAFWANTAGQQLGAVYAPLGLFALFGFVVAIATQNRFIAAVAWGAIRSSKDTGRFLISIGAASAISVALILALHFSIGSSFMPLLSFSPTGTWPAALELIVFGFFTVCLESAVFVSILFTTLGAHSRDAASIALVSLVAAALFWALGIYIAALISVAIFIVFVGSKLADRDLARSAAARLALAALFVAVLFALFHIPVYSSLADELTALFAAFGFMLLTIAYDVAMQNTLGDQIMHAALNGFLLTAILGLPWLCAFIPMLLWLGIDIAIFIVPLPSKLASQFKYNGVSQWQF